MDFEMELLKILSGLTNDDAKKKSAFDAIVDKVKTERFTQNDLFLLLQSLRTTAAFPPERRPDFDDIVKDTLKFKSVAATLGQRPPHQPPPSPPRKPQTPPRPGKKPRR